MKGLVASPDGKQIIKVNGQGDEANQPGKELGRQAIMQGADEILALGSVK